MLLPPLDGGGRVRLRRPQISTIRGAADFDDSLRSATGGADRLTQGRAGPAPPTTSTEGAFLTHGRQAVSFAHSPEAGQCWLRFSSEAVPIEPLYVIRRHEVTVSRPVMSPIDDIHSGQRSKPSEQFRRLRDRVGGGPRLKATVVEMLKSLQIVVLRAFFSRHWPAAGGQIGGFYPVTERSDSRSTLLSRRIRPKWPGSKTCGHGH